MEAKILRSLGFTPGGQPKKWDPYGEDFYNFLERQQSVMRSRAKLANLTIREYNTDPLAQGIERKSKLHADLGESDDEPDGD